jgi:hypothetical protein
MNIFSRTLVFRRTYYLFFLWLSLILITSCNLKVTRPPVPTRTCTNAELTAPSPVSPSNHVIVSSLTPTLSWRFSAWCVPQAYFIQLSTTSNFWDIGLNKLLIGAPTSWTVETVLEEGQDYYWKVVALVMNEETLQLSPGPYSEVRHFNTGERCDALGVESRWVNLIYPAYRETIYTRTPILEWENYSPCLEDYWVEISGYSDFSDSWRTLVHERTELSVREFPGPKKLNHCTWYFWHVWPSRYPDSVSATYEFFVNLTGRQCMTPVEPLVHRTIPRETLGIPPSQTPTSSPVALTATATADVYCLSGPFVTSEQVGIFHKGETALVKARDPDATWFQITLPNTLRLCWVWKDLVILNGEPNSAPVLVVPTPSPAPTISRTPCTEGKPCK